ncbi:TMEM165/GDT1 family protein [Geitlerinema sp. PCC 9228]|uniref:TMEM165/GDT1 family protein n=1 Tax=Geitlerinema sp. PCC 9228 TaxID=111611 RepID=UPI0008F9C018|nr:TMEM165/GDT1 family protein [Geitlerinema sp. PCC 9228]
MTVNISPSTTNQTTANSSTETSSSEPTTSQTPSSSRSTSLGGIWAVFSSTFITILLAEMGDKTQVATLLMSAESHEPWMVFAGAGTALVATSLIGVSLGSWLGNRLSPRVLEKSAGVLLLFVAASLLWEIFA